MKIPTASTPTCRVTAVSKYILSSDFALKNISIRYSAFKLRDTKWMRKNKGRLSLSQ